MAQPPRQPAARARSRRRSRSLSRVLSRSARPSRPGPFHPARVVSESAPLVRKLVPPHLDEAIARLAVRQHGVVALAQLRELGLSARAVQARAARGRLHRLYRGVYALGHVALTVQGTRLAAVLACGPAAVLSHRSAAAAWGLRPTSRARLEVSTTARGCRGAAGIDVHRPRRI